VRNGKFVIMFVCTGNTCRSPMAHGIMRSIVEREKLANVEVTSSGTGTLNGYPATSNAVMAAHKDGVDISDLHSDEISVEMVEEADLILVMAYEHYQLIVSVYPEAADRVFMLRAFPEREANRKLSVEDPIGADFDTYRGTYEEIKRELERAFPFIKNRIDEKTT